MRLHDLKLATRVTIGVLSMVVAGAATLLLVENARLRDAYLSERRTHLGLDLETETLRLNQAINKLRQDVLFLSNTPPVSGIMRATLNHGYDARDGDTRARWEKRLQKIFSAFSSAHPNYYQIRYIGVADGGREIVRIDNRGEKIEITPSDKLQAKGGRGYFKATLGLREGQVSLSKFNLEQESVIAQPTLHASTPIFDPDGKLFGMVVINMDVGSLLKSAVPDLPGVQTYMANSDGQYLFHPDSQQAFKFELGSKDKITTDFPFIASMFNPQAADYLPLQAVATKPDGSLFAAMRIRFDPGDPSRFLLLMHYLPDTTIAQQVATIHADTILYEFMVMLLVGGVATLVLRRTFSPLKQITAAADKIAAGDRTLLLPTGGGEIGSLTNALNVMLTRVSQREKLLQKSETRYRRLHESMMDAYVMVDMSGRLLEFNHTYREMLGYSADEKLQRVAYIDLMPEKWHEFEAQIVEEQVIPQDYSQVHEKEYIRKDGTVFPVELKYFLLRDTNNQPEAMWAIVRDITERKQAERLLRESAEKIEDLYNQAPCGYHSLDKDGVILMINDTELAWLGYTWDEVVGQMKMTDLLTPESSQIFHETFPQLKKRGSVHDIEIELIRKDGTVFIGLISATAIYDFSGDYVMSRSTVTDITGRKQMENKLHDLTAHLQSVREEEKISIAREIHDDMGGTLTALKIETHWLKTELSANMEATSLLDHVGEMAKLIDNAADAMHRIITGLRPAMLDELGLLAALEWQAAQFQKLSGIECRVNSVCANGEGCEKELDKLRSITLFRIFQEALTNVAKHSGASLVEIEFCRSDEEVVMSIIDNGRGMTENRIATSIPYGMLGMRERVDQLGGTINFETPPGGGFDVTVILPLPAREKEKT